MNEIERLKIFFWPSVVDILRMECGVWGVILWKLCRKHICADKLMLTACFLVQIKDPCT